MLDVFFLDYPDSPVFFLAPFRSAVFPEYKGDLQVKVYPMRSASLVILNVSSDLE